MRIKQKGSAYKDSFIEENKALKARSSRAQGGGRIAAEALGLQGKRKP